jgi:hypothetical protein
MSCRYQHDFFDNFLRETTGLWNDTKWSINVGKKMPPLLLYMILADWNWYCHHLGLVQLGCICRLRWSQVVSLVCSD